VTTENSSPIGPTNKEILKYR